MDESERGAAAVTESRQRRRTTGDDGAAVVEMALVGSLLFLLLFGIICFGFAMSLQQNIRQAAAEGARAAAVAPASGGFATAKSEAQLATENAVGEFGQHCTGNVSCIYPTAPCPAADGATTDIAPLGSGDHCIKVEVVLDTSTEWFANIPLISSIMPSELKAKSVIEINQP